MLKYLVILLDDNSVSYCHYQNRNVSKLMSLETLRKGIMFSMKNDLRIQYVLPKTNLSEEYYKYINSMFHDIIAPAEQEKLSDVIVFDGFNKVLSFKGQYNSGKKYIIRTTVEDFFTNSGILKKMFAEDISVNVVFSDVESFTDDKIGKYQNILCDLAVSVKNSISSGHNINTNLLTDRIALDEMNNCGAGDTSITLAPDGKFYPCPGFYYSQHPYSEIGDIDKGVNILNGKLFTLECSPLCKRCDAFHCKRCVWLNKRMTYEVNVPSRQQCVMAHIERNASKNLLDEFHKCDLLKRKKIDSINYLDPFDEYQNV